MNSLLFHLLVLPLTLRCWLLLRSFLVHFNICWLLFWLSSAFAFLSGLFLILFSLLGFLFLLLFLFGDSRLRKIEDGGDFGLECFELAFYLFDGIWEVFGLRLFESCVDLSEVVVNHFDLVNDALLSLLSEIICLSCRGFGKLGLHYAGFELAEEVNPFSDFASESVAGFDWISDSSEGSHSVLVLLQRCLFALSVYPVNSGLQILQERVFQRGVDIVLVIAVGVALTFHVV